MSVNERLASIEVNLKNLTLDVREMKDMLEPVGKKVQDNSNDIVWIKKLASVAFGTSTIALAAWWKKYNP